MPAGKFMREIQETQNAAIDTADRQVLLTGRMYRIPSPVEGSAAQIRSAVEHRLGARLDMDGNLVWLDDR
jgi:hypothetical protein